MATNVGWIILLILVLVLSSCSRSTLNFVYTPDSGQNAPADYSFNVVGEGYDSYHWNFGDGAESRDSSTEFRFYLSGVYEITLTGNRGKKKDVIKKEIIVKAPEKCIVKIETSQGEMIVELFDDTPKHRDNFIKLVEEGYYEGLLFHRVIQGFMVQGGDPNSRNAPGNQPLGTGGPGYQIDAEFMQNRAHVKGALAAARMGDPVNPERKSSGSQFYIVQGRSVDENSINQFEQRLNIQYPDEVRSMYLENGGVPFLDQQYTVFGQVIEGLGVIDRIAQANTNAQDRPLEDIKMSISLIK